MPLLHVAVALLSIAFILSGVAGLFVGSRTVAIVELAVGCVFLYFALGSKSGHPRV